MSAVRAIWKTLFHPPRTPSGPPSGSDDQLSGDIRQALQRHASSSRLVQQKACENAEEAHALAEGLARRVEAHKARDVIATAEAAIKLIQEDRDRAQ